MENVGTNVTIEKKIKCSFYKKTTFFYMVANFNIKIDSTTNYVIFFDYLYSNLLDI